MTAQRTMHGESYTRLYRTWKQIRKRCTNPNTADYRYYGGKGIRVCEDWSDYQTFRQWAVTHGYEDNLTIDRIDSNRDYEPSNCRWIPQVEQLYNRSNTVRIEYKGEIHTIEEWSDITGLSKNVIRNRRKKGWDTERMLTEPKRVR